MNPGVSIVICTHNGAERLPETLAHLRDQIVPAELPWEVLLIDNASTDDTVAIARNNWPETDPPAPLRIVPEPRLGVGYARNRAVREAHYDFLIQVDDDNWLCPEYVACVAEIFQAHPEVAVCGGPSQGVFETPPPDWFDRYSYAYAIGNQTEATGCLSLTQGFIWGAGMAVRRHAWQALLDAGMEFYNVARVGGKLGGGEDVELCLALRLAGWKLWYDTRLQIQHYMTAPRLNWRYLRRLHRGFGAAEIGHLYYRQVISSWPDAPQVHFHQVWWRQALSWTVQFLRQRQNWRALFGLAAEGDPSVLAREVLYGRLLMLLTQRGNYDLGFAAIANAPWREAACPQNYFATTTD